MNTFKFESIKLWERDTFLMYFTSEKNNGKEFDDVLKAGQPISVGNGI